MKHILFGLMVPAFLIMMSVEVQASDLKAINDEDTFRAMIVGKKLTWLDGDGTVTVRKNGKISGRFDRQRLVGQWIWSKGRFCRTVKLGKNDAREACQRVHASSDRVRFTETTSNRVTNYRY